MPTWKLRSPNQFLMHWHEALKQGEGERPLAHGLREGEAKSYANKFRAFRYCLRAYPTFPAAQIERDFNCKISLRQDFSTGALWDVWLIVKPRIDPAIFLEALARKD